MKSISHYLLIFGLLFLFSCTPSNKKPPKGLEGSWLSISQEGDGFFEGFFMKINNGERIFQFAYSDTLVYENVTFNDSTIIYDDSANIQIRYIGKDSLQLVFPYTFTSVTYLKLPFEETGSVKIKESDLLQNEWYLIDGNEKFRVDFIDYTYKMGSKYKSFHLGFNILNWGQYFGWDIMDFDGHTYLISSAYSIFEPMVYQITDFGNDSVSLSYFDTYFTKELKEIKLAKSKPLSEKMYQHQVDKLANHQFKLVDYQFESQFETGTWDTVPLKRIHRFFRKFGIEREMTFKFSSDSLFVFNNRGAYLKGSWELSKDGHNIKVFTTNDLFMMGIKLEENLHLNIKGSQNIRNIYDGHQVDYLELKLEEY
jgi:hypothetical protein